MTLPDTVANHFWPDGHRTPNLFAVFDPARDPDIYPALRRFAAAGHHIAPLYQGRAAADFAGLSPCLVQFDTHGVILDWFLHAGWGRSWAILLWSLVTPDGIRDHLRRHIYARRQDGKLLLFRFYDPRVLRQVLPRLDPAQATDLFGTTIARFSMESESADAIETYTQGASGVRRAVIDVNK